jgi:beta-aspartyl-peptidase (threonine type)
MEAGRDAVASVVAAVEVMEDSDLFNAGRGSNFDSDGVVSMDASIMVGDTLAAGAVAGVRDVRHPIRLARHVMEDCPHVMLAGEGAETFAREVGMPSTPADFFFTQRRWDDLQAAKAREAQGNDAPNTVDVDRPADVPAPPGLDFGTATDSGGTASAPSVDPDTELRDNSGTVGAVALDKDGMLVAGTSTGGSANKKWGRIGDSPVIAAGTYAGSHCGVSCTGWGEYFIRHAVAHDIQARMAYKGLTLREATHQVVMESLEDHRRGLGGVVAMDREGNAELCFNTRGMYRGWVDREGRMEVAIF